MLEKVKQMSMGFHVINIDSGILRHEYVNSFENLAFLDIITDDSIIYQGEQHWTPCKVSDVNLYRHLSKDWFRAGIKAQELFKKHALENQLILEELSQTQETFRNYTLNSQSLSIKRGDFLLRNLGNIEVDVKCRSFYKSKYGERKLCFNFKCEDLEKHSNMQLFTKTPVVIAIYERNGDTPIEDKVYFFSIDDLRESKKEFKIIKVNAENTGKCYQIPIDRTSQGFEFLKELFEKL